MHVGHGDLSFYTGPMRVRSIDIKTKFFVNIPMYHLDTIHQCILAVGKGLDFALSPAYVSK